MPSPSSAGAVIATVVLAAGLAAPATSIAADPVEPTVSASPAPIVSRSPLASPSASPFPWPSIARPAEDPDLVPFVAQGPPAAVGRRDGVVVKLWLEQSSVGQGEWIQALVRTTNTRPDPVWMWPAECRTSSTRVDVDLGPIIDPGAPQEGKAKAYKRHALRASGALKSHFPPWEPRRDGVRSWRFVECGGISPPRWIKLRPGATMEERFAWYPARYMDVLQDRLQPLPPGTVQVTASWQYVGHGEPPRKPKRSLLQPITATAPLELTGVDPGTPSVPELIDFALEEPEFRAWVEAHPDRKRWSAMIQGWSASTPLGQPRWQGLAGKAPNGFVEIWLDQNIPGVEHLIGVALVDPWTGEVVDVGFQ